MAAASYESQLDPSSIALLRAQLEPDEQLLWASKPQWLRDAFLRIRVAAIFIGLGFIMMGCFYLRPWHGWGNVVTYMVGTTCINFAIIWKGYHSDRDSLFGLTNKRALRMWPMHSVALINEHGQPASIRRRIFGRLTIGDTTVSAWNGIPRYVKPGNTAFLDFFAFPDLDDAMRIAVEAQRNELQERSKAPAA